MIAKEKDIIFFDLDGTLTDPFVGITKSVQYALKKFGIIEAELRNLIKFIGPPLHRSFMDFYGFSREEGLKAVEYYREYYAPTGIFENKVYPGIPELLKTLCDGGRRLAVATSKPEQYAEQILSHYGLSQYFEFIGGALMDGRTDKAEVIGYVLHEMNVSGDRVVMVGDREHDIIGAKKCGLSSVGVLYGYGSRKELSDAGADRIVRDIKELSELLSGE